MPLRDDVHIEAADKVVKVPGIAAKEKWSAERAQQWARQDVLHGGPPDKPRDAKSGEKVDWASVKDYAGKSLRIIANPDGLLITGPDGKTRFVAGDTTRGGFGVASGTSSVRAAADSEALIRDFARKEIGLYNKDVAENIRKTEARPPTREFFEAGRRIREFVIKHERGGVTQDSVWYALEQWGRGVRGYAKTQLEHATYFYDWKKGAAPDDPIFGLDETTIMIVLRGSRDGKEREALAKAVMDGPYRQLNADQRKWAFGLFHKTFPGDEQLWNALAGLRQRVIQAEALSDEDRQALERLRLLKKTKAAKTDQDDAMDA